jgi:serine/threonine protein kinase
MAVMAQHLRGAIPRLDKELKGIVSPQLAAFVVHCLQRDPKDRYTDMHALISDLDNLESIDISILEKSAGPGSAASFWRNPIFIAVGSAFALLLVIIILALILQHLR